MRFHPGLGPFGVRCPNSMRLFADSIVARGGWGSWSSFWHGPPFKGKRIDIRRPIDIGVSAPVVLDKETLSDQLRTRELLKQMVLEGRRHLKTLPSPGFAGEGRG